MDTITVLNAALADEALRLKICGKVQTDQFVTLKFADITGNRQKSIFNSW